MATARTLMGGTHPSSKQLHTTGHQVIDCICYKGAGELPNVGSLLHQLSRKPKSCMHDVGRQSSVLANELDRTSRNCNAATINVDDAE
eukprot:2935907-Amphidinium_carterae.1